VYVDRYVYMCGVCVRECVRACVYVHLPVFGFVCAQTCGLCVCVRVCSSSCVHLCAINYVLICMNIFACVCLKEQII
jgi:hypothetical protein